MSDIKAILNTARGKIVFDDLSMLAVINDIVADTDDLKEDMLQIQYDNNLIIDVGWYPSFSRKGKFTVVLIYNMDWDNPVRKKTARAWSILLKALEEIIAVANSFQA
ncbi:hypothetical protein [Pedobacter sp. SYP-B3415]|uniref:hypothetical protein n=1 Tax=Pedobacter sp. SYP-B3415 TaxID=2496641 RepID=UPI00101D4D0E|nr:hypothetical protein [Pedobacter sp. SYP-B3415]